MQKVRCAIYTRKSSEDGLEQEFNTLHAQREACEAYITSQKHEGWVCLENAYNDGGLSAGTPEREALRRLLADIEAGLVDQVIVYKIDRLTRSLTGFSKIVDVLDWAAASFVSVTQSFNTATSIGSLTLNMLSSFAQFEREGETDQRMVRGTIRPPNAERIRDKIAASKREGLWMGGNVPPGYRLNGRSWDIHEDEAKTVRTLFDLYLKHKTVRIVKKEADKRRLRTAVRTKPDGCKQGGDVFSIGHIHHILTNPIYAGQIRHKGKVYEGQHDAIINQSIWKQAQASLQGNARIDRQKPMARGANRKTGRKTQSSPLIGKLFDETGDPLSPSHSKARNGSRLRYYISHRLTRGTREAHPDAWRLPAEEFEQRVAQAIRHHLTEPQVITHILNDQTAQELKGIEGKIESAGTLDILSLIERIDIRTGTLSIALNRAAVADWLGHPEDRLCSQTLTFEASFQQRKRGVETKLILGGTSRTRDLTLIRNIALGHKYLALIKQGLSYGEIAEQESASKRMVQNLIDYAFLAPDIVERICNGDQPIGLTSEWIKHAALPAGWNSQQDLIN